MFGNAKMKRPDTEFQATYIKAFGKNNEKVEARENVTMVDYENNVRLSGNLLEYDKESEYTHITEDAKIEFLSIVSMRNPDTLIGGGTVTLFGNLAPLTTDMGYRNGEAGRCFPYDQPFKLVTYSNLSLVVNLTIVSTTLTMEDF